MQDNPDAFRRMDWKKGVQKPRDVEPGEQVITGASSEAVANFAEAMDAAKTHDRRNPPKPRGWRRFFRRTS